MELCRWLVGSLLVIVPFNARAEEPEPVPVRLPSEEARDHTYFLVVNGMDPLLIGRLDCFCDAIRCAGYKNVEMYMLRHGCCTEKRICEIKANDPSAKIVLV